MYAPYKGNAYGYFLRLLSVFFSNYIYHLPQTVFYITVNVLSNIQFLIINVLCKYVSHVWLR